MTDSTADLYALAERYYVPVYRPRRIVLDHGRGSRVWDRDGVEYIDFGAGIAVNALGHAHPALLAALHEQAGKLWHTSNVFVSEPPLRLAQALVEASGFAERVFFCNSGAEANEAAIKLARRWASAQGRGPERRTILSFRGSVCAVLVEPVQGEGGVTPATPGFLAGLRELCDRHDALLICDEIQCGMGRTGHLFASHGYGVEPDVVTLAKALGSGFPIGAMLVGARAADTLSFGVHGTTFGGNPLAAAVAGAALKELTSAALMENVSRQADAIRAGLAALHAEFDLFDDVRGAGLMIGAQLRPAHAGRAGDILDACIGQGLLLLQAGPDVLRFVPALNIGDDDIAEGLRRLRRALAGCLAPG